MINKAEQVFEMDCDLDTLICWLQNNQDWFEKISQVRTKKHSLSKVILRIQRFIFPPRLIMRFPGNFCVKVRGNLLQPIVFSIVEGTNALEIMAGEPINNVTQIGNTSRSIRIKSAFRFYEFRLKTAYNSKTKRFSERYLNAFVNLIQSAGLPPAKGRS